MEFAPPGAEGDKLADNFQVAISYDRAVARSRRASDRIEAIVDNYREEWVDSEAAELGIAGAEREQFRIVQENVSSDEQMGALLLGMMIPLFLVLMVALGCFIPAIDSTAGERERSTWETLMTVSASRLSVVTAKYLYVATVGIIAGVLNVTAVFLSLGAIMAPLLAEAGDQFQFTLPFLALPVMIVAAISLALFFAAAMMILASFARSFKDGQAMAMPVYWLALLPFVLGQQTDRTLTPVIAAIPVANAAMMIRDAINGVFLWPLMAETLVVLLVMVALCLMLARMVLQFEDLLVGSFELLALREGAPSEPERQEDRRGQTRSCLTWKTPWSASRDCRSPSGTSLEERSTLSTASTSTVDPGRSSGSSGPTAPARRRPSECSRRF